ncbi:tyrosine-type recombinase/integrase [Roseateles albus]|uniref:Tyrosine-type recombinase/integrase n=1 Tax=Roseateles albus TaxID=2987525 RepID=A0ABT5KAP3_9BURK|nr:tyrosine-type recombinase/integrase [Roseateles albus]MDC8770988.1 tyrosine-type recombinase/integrase [Roseateles albus]
MSHPTLTLRNGIYHFNKMVNGHQIRQSTRTSDLKLAEKIAAKIEHDAVQSIMFSGKKPVHLHAAIKAFLSTRQGGGYSNAVTHLKHFEKLPDKRIDSLALYEVQSVVTKRRAEGLSHNTLAVLIVYWNALQNFCEEQGWTSGVKLKSMKQVKTRFRVLSKDEEQKLFHAIDPNVNFPGRNPIKIAQRQDNVDLLVCLLSMGCRLNEVQRMQWSQVDFAANVVHVKRLKDGVDSAITMTAKLRETLQRRAVEHEVCGWVFPSKIKKCNTRWINAAVKRAGISEAAGKITLHTMRHCVATRLLAGGLSLVEVQSMLGHKNIASTMVYSQIVPTAAAIKAAAILEA